MNKLLEIKNLDVFIEKAQILKNFQLALGENQIHVIMGPNGSGKSTLAKVLAGHPAYTIKEGQIHFCEKDLLTMSPELRAREGLFLAFQYPIEIAGVTNYDFLRIAYNEKRKYFQEPEVNPLEFMELTQFYAKKLNILPEFFHRNLNEGFSGGEKKRNEVLQMLLLNPKLIILDEIDSGLDIDALKLICQGILENKDKNASLLIITHYPKIFQYFYPDFVHIMMDGKIIETGGMEIVETLEKEGYQAFRK